MDAPAPVLVVDDDEDIRDTVVLILQVDGYLVAAASDGGAALRWIESHGPPSMILLDMMMPGMNGEDFVHALRKLDCNLAQVPVVILTADTRAEEKAKTLGVQACLQKPVELRELEETVHRFVEPSEGSVRSRKLGEAARASGVERTTAR